MALKTRIKNPFKKENHIGGKEMKRWGLMMWMVISIGMSAPCLYADDTDLFMIQVPPDVLIILDLSGSMDWTPAGSTLYIGSDDGDDSNDNLVDCSIDGPFYSKSGPGHTKPCYGTFSEVRSQIRRFCVQWPFLQGFRDRTYY